MRIKEINLKSYRHTEGLYLKFNKSINIICGRPEIDTSSIFRLISDELIDIGARLTNISHFIDIQNCEINGYLLINNLERDVPISLQPYIIPYIRSKFSNLQLISTSSSPLILQCLRRDEIIPLYLDKNDQVIQPLELGFYGLQGWTLEEIIQNVLEVTETTSRLYQEMLSKFDEAMNNDDRDIILQQYKLLKEMLHPENLLHKLLDIQVAAWR